MKCILCKKIESSERLQNISAQVSLRILNIEVMVRTNPDGRIDVHTYIHRSEVVTAMSISPQAVLTKKLWTFPIQV